MSSQPKKTLAPQRKPITRASTKARQAAETLSQLKTQTAMEKQLATVEEDKVLDQLPVETLQAIHSIIQQEPSTELKATTEQPADTTSAAFDRVLHQNKTTSLSSEPGVPFTIAEKATDMTPNEVETAFHDLVNKSFIKKYPAVERYCTDPEYRNQKIFVISFIPAKGAQPDANGLYGIAKFRGAFENEQEADDLVLRLIKGTDSYHPYLYGRVGQPFPMSLEDKYCEGKKIVDIKNNMIDVISQHVKQERDKERIAMKEIEEKEKKLFETPSEEQSNEDKYITLRVSKAYIVHTVLSTEKKLYNLKKSYKRKLLEIEQMDADHPELKGTYLAKYKKAREDAGIQESENDLIKFLGDDMFMDVSGIPLDDDDDKK